jgi:hypothetical protein
VESPVIVRYFRIILISYDYLPYPNDGDSCPPPTGVRSHNMVRQMGFWSIFKGRRENFVFSDAPPSQNLRDALQEAGNHPLNDFTWRIVVASPNCRWSFDITLFQADEAFTAYERVGRQKSRHNAASIILDSIKGRSVDDATMGAAAFAFFDTDFTVGANKGKTRETAWNTLALDAECENGRLQVTRSAHRLTFPFAPLNLDFVDVLNRFTGGKK